MKNDVITIFYNSRSIPAKKIVNRAKGLVPGANACDACEPKKLRNLLNVLDKATNNLLIRQHPRFRSGRPLGESEMMEILKTPLAVRGERAVFCREATDVYRLLDRSEPAIFF